MTMNEGKSSNANLMETITEFLASPDGLSRAEIREALKDDGVDLQQLSNRYTAFLASAKKAQSQSPSWEMYEELYSLLDQVIKKAEKEEEEVTSG